jgi:hypothetical protein
MRGRLAILSVCAGMVVGLTVQANEKPTESYQKTMKDLSAANTALRNDVKAAEAAGAYPDYIPVEKDAAALKTAFESALSFSTARKADDAVKAAGAGVSAADDLTKAIKEKNYDAVAAAATAIGATCAGCHTAHRERLPDGTYEIK